jgi:hypothetical protein
VFWGTKYNLSIFSRYVTWHQSSSRQAASIDTLIAEIGPHTAKLSLLLVQAGNPH